MADLVYNHFKMAIMAGTYSLIDGNVYVILLNNSYTPDVDADISYSDISANETAGANYRVGGHALSTPALSQDDTDNQGVFDAVDWTIYNVTLTGTGTVRYAVLWQSTGADGDLICCFDFTTDQSVTAGTFTISWNAEGILTLT